MAILLIIYYLLVLSKQFKCHKPKPSPNNKKVLLNHKVKNKHFINNNKVLNKNKDEGIKMVQNGKESHINHFKNKCFVDLLWCLHILCAPQ